MILGYHHIFQYLTSFGLISNENLFEQNEVYTISKPRSLNNTFVIYKNNEPFAVIKQAFMDDAFHRESQLNEYGIYNTEWIKVGNFEFNKHLPTLYEDNGFSSFDKKKGVLFIKYIKDTKSLYIDEKLTFNKLRVDISSLTELFYGFHYQLFKEKKNRKTFECFAPKNKVIKMPTILNFFLEITFKSTTSLENEITKRLKNHPRWIKFLENRNQFWRINHQNNLIHCDLSPKNILKHSTNNNLYIVDWELCQFGNPDYDIAYYLNELEEFLSEDDFREYSAELKKQYNEIRKDELVKHQNQLKANGYKSFDDEPDEVESFRRFFKLFKIYKEYKGKSIDSDIVNQIDMILK